MLLVKNTNNGKTIYVVGEKHQQRQVKKHALFCKP
jgi:hypothetical protein